MSRHAYDFFFLLCLIISSIDFVISPWYTTTRHISLYFSMLFRRCFDAAATRCRRLHFAAADDAAI